MKTLKQSLRKKPTYNELVNYIEEDIPIKYPDRTATFLRNSHYLSQFDGDTFIDLEEQEKNIEKEKFKEAEVKKIAAETQTTAQVVRATKKSISLQTGGIRNTESSSSGTQTDRPLTVDAGTKAPKLGQRTGTQTDRISTATGDTQTNRMSGVGIQTDGPSTQIFDMTMDDATDAAMADAEAEEQAAREREQRRTQNIVNLVSRHLGENVRDLPYLPISTASSSSKGPAPDLPAEDTSNPRGRPSKNPAINDGTENTTQKRGRKPKVAGEGSNPMIVNQEQEQHKRSKSGETASPPARKRLNKKTEDKELKKIQAAIQRQDAEEAKQMKKIEKAVGKADVKHGVAEINNKDKKWWEKQNITVIKQQAELRGHRFTDLETKGGTKTVGGVKTKFKKFKKPEYLEVLFKLLKI